MTESDRYAYIRRTLEQGDPHMGSETEGIVVDPKSFEVVHSLGGRQPTQAVRLWLREMGGAEGESAARVIVPDVPETTIEANPPPLRSPRSTAAAQRLLSILTDAALQGLGGGEEGPQLLHGAAWRPPRLTDADASQHVGPFKRLYYQFQIGAHGDKVGAAAGDHLNLSAPWLGQPGKSEMSRKMIEMTGRMRLIAGALSIGLTACSPLYFGIDREPRYHTAITPWESARLGHVWPGRTIMDVSGLNRDPISFRRTLGRFADTGTLLTGRDVWLIARAQAGAIPQHGPTFEEVCAEIGIDLATKGGFAEARQLLFACFSGGLEGGGPVQESRYSRLEEWRQVQLGQVIRAPRNRVEIRTLETPPAFAPDSPGGSYQTPYEYLKAMHAFLEVLFIYLCENPPFVEDLEYGELELQAAKSNEQAVLHRGLDARVLMISDEMHHMSARDYLRWLLEQMSPLSEGLGRSEDLALVHRIARGEELPPAARIRQEVAQRYGIAADLRHNTRLLPDDEYPRRLLARTRAAMANELDAIEADIATVPALDQPYLNGLLGLVRRLRRARQQAA